MTVVKSRYFFLYSFPLQTFAPFSEQNNNYFIVLIRLAKSDIIIKLNIFMRKTISLYFDLNCGFQYFDYCRFNEFWVDQSSVGIRLILRHTYETCLCWREKWKWGKKRRKGTKWGRVGVVLLTRLFFFIVMRNHR